MFLLPYILTKHNSFNVLALATEGRSVFPRHTRSWCPLGTDRPRPRVHLTVRLLSAKTLKAPRRDRPEGGNGELVEIQ
jgi:hypothetical protein